MQTAFDESLQYLRRHSIKPSVQRTAVMAFLLRNRIHPTVDDIYTALSPQMPTLSRTTIYNTLSLFLDCGAVQVLSLDGKNARYDVDTSEHAHFICSGCGAVSDIFNINPLLFSLPDISELEISSVEISYRGLCVNCRES